MPNQPRLKRAFKTDSLTVAAGQVGANADAARVIV
jgi:hypothetical protein